mgnify:CR=1 FL=1
MTIVTNQFIQFVYYFVSAEHLLRIIGRNSVYDANVAASQVQTDLRERVCEKAIVEVTESPFIPTVAIEYFPDSDEVEEVASAA